MIQESAEQGQRTIGSARHGQAVLVEPAGHAGMGDSI